MKKEWDKIIPPHFIVGIFFLQIASSVSYLQRTTTSPSLTSNSIKLAISRTYEKFCKDKKRTKLVSHETPKRTGKLKEKEHLKEGGIEGEELKRGLIIEEMEKEM